MISCLGLFIENNLIKYAKVSKNREDLKVEAYGMKFYDKIGETLKQIIEETNSKKVPISINLSEEMYNYFSVFSLLNKKDLKAALNSEFELLCEDKGYNINILESRYILTKDYVNKEKLKAIYISVNKAELARKMQQLEGYRIGALSPLPIAITNILSGRDNDNVAIVNIENKTSVTTILDGEISSVDILNIGMQEILEKINEKENSFAKVYEICKNTTIYLDEEKSEKAEKNEYLEYIMPTLYNIVKNVRETLDEKMMSIKKIYITGAAAVINNIDLYFREYLMDIKCEILKPYFLDTASAKINIREYIEVNSAIALALQGLGEGEKDINFKNASLKNNISDILKLDLDFKLLSNINIKEFFKIDFKKELDGFERALLRLSTGLLLVIILYSGVSVALTKAIYDKEAEVQAVIDDTNSQIALIDDNTNKIKTKTNTYNNLIQNLDEMSEKATVDYQTKKAIPNLLNSIMSVIPRDVQLTSIENTTSKHIVISAQAEKYEQLGYFTAILKTEGILLNVESSSGLKQSSVVKITIEGDLP